MVPFVIWRPEYGAEHIMILRSDTAPRELQFCENVPVALTVDPIEAPRRSVRNFSTRLRGTAAIAMLASLVVRQSEHRPFARLDLPPVDERSTLDDRFRLLRAPTGEVVHMLDLEDDNAPRRACTFVISADWSSSQVMQSIQASMFRP